MAATDAVLELQEELAYQGETLRNLNDALGAQQQDMLLLRRQLTLLAAEVQALRAAGDADDRGDNAAGSADEKPPHY